MRFHQDVIDGNTFRNLNSKSYLIYLFIYFNQLIIITIIAFALSLFMHFRNVENLLNNDKSKNKIVGSSNLDEITYLYLFIPTNYSHLIL